MFAWRRYLGVLGVLAVLSIAGPVWAAVPTVAFSGARSLTSGLGVPALELSGLGAAMIRKRVVPARAPGPGLSLMSTALRAPKSQDEPDDLDVIPELVPLVNPDAPEASPEAEAGQKDPALSFDAVDLSGDAEAEDGPADAALLTAPPVEPPEGGKKRSIVRRWWFWAAVGAVAVAGGGIAVASSGPELVLPEGSLGTLDRR